MELKTTSNRQMRPAVLRAPVRVRGLRDDMVYSCGLSPNSNPANLRRDTDWCDHVPQRRATLVNFCIQEGVTKAKV